jgi:CRISPR-associated protein Cmr3
VSAWLIEPRDPLIARDGRPASTAQFRTVRFPFPSMLAGAVRTRLAAGDGPFTLAGAALDELRQIAVHGPLLAELAGDGDEVAEWYAPAPRDLLWVPGDDGGLALRRLVPRAPGPGRLVDSLPAAGLLPVFPPRGARPGKLPPGLPAFWRWEELERWLCAPADRDGVDPDGLGAPDLPTERRVHLALRPGERVGIDGAIFMTSGLRFLGRGNGRLAPRRFALGLRCDGGTVQGRPMALSARIAPLGGDRRLARWFPAAQEWPALPAAVRASIVAERRARIVLLTPACFEGGAIPGWSEGGWPGGGPVRAAVRAACVPRPDIVSGWDLAAGNGPGKPKGRPKPTRRLAPAGSVYFVELAGGTAEDIGRWCDAAWLAPVSDGAQDRRDGFGLAALGVWEDAP